MPKRSTRHARPAGLAVICLGGVAALCLLFLLARNAATRARVRYHEEPSAAAKLLASSGIPLEELPQRVVNDLNEMGVPRRFVRGIEVCFSNQIPDGEASHYYPDLQQIRLPASEPLVGRYSRGFMYDLFSYVSDHAFSVRDLDDFDDAIRNYDAKARPLFSTVDLSDGCSVQEAETLEYLNPLAEKGASAEEKRSLVFEAYYADASRETWNYERMAQDMPGLVMAKKAGRARFRSEFEGFFSRFSGTEGIEVRDIQWNLPR